ncbi:unnamed protein product [Rotaria sordida]|uniref:Uncharacterized protein n=1 Tax=Rotaria sordida TaxID=392033 RepID=A0A815EEV7_9BILA|nr:unnamed protein product [Rotaria sordida]CAF1310490.1 unnamed protein product [Rotaria sordida]
MASDSPVISDENNMTHSKSIITGSSLEEHSNYGFHEISSTTVKIQQLKTDLNAENQYERHALTELNEELRLIVDRAHQLELQNSQYMTKLFNLRQQVFINRITGIQTDEHNHVQTNIIKFNYDKVSYESEIELFQLQSKIYEEMLQFETQSIDEQRLKLEQELKQSSSALIDLRKSYTELEQRVGSFRVESELESNLKTIQIQHNEKFEAQTTELQYLYESIMAMVSSVEEIQRRKNFLESEIIIYRHILGAEVAEKSSNENIFSSSLYQKIVLNDVYSMGI